MPFLALIFGFLLATEVLAKTPTPIPTTSVDGVFVSDGTWKATALPGYGWADPLNPETGWTNAVVYTLYGDPSGYVNFVPNFSDSAAKSIWTSNSNSPDQAAFRGHFFLPQVPAVAQVRVWADDFFDLYINGQPFFTDLVGGSYCLSVPSSFLLAGDNVLAVYGLDNPQPGLPSTARNAVALDFRYILNASPTPTLTPPPTLTPSPAAQLSISKAAQPLLAEAGATVTYTLSYSNQATDLVDVVWVVDSSGSMAPYQQAIGQNASSFLSRLTGTDFRVGVVDYCFVPEGGNPAQPLPVAMETDGSRHQVQDLGGAFTVSQSEFSTMITSVGDQGSGAEHAFKGLQDALQSLYEFRPGARKAFILVTDEVDFDYVYQGDRDPGTGILDETMSLMNQAGAVVYVVSSKPADYSGAPTNHYWDSGPGPYPQVLGIAPGTGGAFQDINTADWSGLLSVLGLDIAKLTALNLHVEDDLPPGETFLSSSPAPATVAGLNLSWDLGALGAGQSGAITFSAVLTGAQSGEVLHNDADVSASNALASTSLDAAVTVMSATVTKTYTYTNSPSLTGTGSPTPSRTLTFTYSPVPSLTATGTASPSQTPTATATQVPSLTPSTSGTRTNSPTITFTAPPSKTPTVSASDTPSRTISASPTASASFTASFTVSATATWTPTPTDSPTVSATETWSFTASPTLSFTISATLTRSATRTATATNTPTFSHSPLPTNSRTPTPTSTFSTTPTISATLTDSATPTDSLTPSPTPSLSPTASSTTTASASTTPTRSPPSTKTTTWSPTQTRTRTATRTGTRTPSPTRTSTVTGTPTYSPSASPQAYRLSITIYNEAGEKVALLDAGSSSQALLVLPSPGDLTPNGSGLLFKSASGLVLAAWDGKDSHGNLVPSGVYYALLSSRDDQDLVQTATVSFLVLRGGDSEAVGMDLVPNPAPGPHPDNMEVRIQGPPGWNGEVRLFTLSGERVWSSPVRGAMVLHPDRDLAPGIYLVLLSGRDAAGRPVRLLRRWVIL